MKNYEYITKQKENIKIPIKIKISETVESLRKRSETTERVDWK